MQEFICTVNEIASDNETSGSEQEEKEMEEKSVAGAPARKMPKKKVRGLDSGVRPQHILVTSAFHVEYYQF